MSTTKTSKFLDDPVFMGHLQSLAAGQTTRAQICEALGISASQLSQRIGYCGWQDKLRHTKLSRNHAHRFVEDPDNAKALATAVLDAQSSGKPLTQVAREHNVNYQALYKRLKTAEKYEKGA